MRVTTYQVRPGYWGAACTFGETRAPVARTRPIYASALAARIALSRIMSA